MRPTYDQDAPEVTILSDRTRTARKPCACDTCRRPIPEGKPYRYVSGVEDGDFFVSRTHLSNCWEA